MIFSMHGTFFRDFPGFPWFPELVGTLNTYKEGTEDPLVAHMSFSCLFKDQKLKVHTKTQSSRCNNLKQEEFLSYLYEPM